MSGSAGGPAEPDLPRQAPRRATAPTARLHGVRRLRVRRERRADIHDAVLEPACCLITLPQTDSFW